ncbi:MAG: hypothetical protein Q7S24_02475, partial [bacterium]|nr:hypothetical protein [bacterium]
VVIPSLQQTWLISTAKLLDEAYFRGKEDQPNLSLYYIKEKLEDGELSKWLTDKLKEQQIFINNIKDLRNKFLAHNDLNDRTTVIKTGVEIFFTTISDYIKLIKNKKPHLINCDDLLLEKIEMLSQRGVGEIFDRITPK